MTVDFPFPAAFEARMRRLLGADWASFAAAYDAPVRRGVRANPLKTDTAALPRHLRFAVTPVPFAADGYATEADWKAGTDPLHHAGAYYVQEPSAMSAVTALAPRAGEWVLDLCAAPGGKSTQIAAALGGDGLLWSNEYVASRASVLVQNLERCGVRNAVVSNMDTVPLCDALARRFDAVLVDAPCSGEGMFRKEPAALRDWSEQAVTHCVGRGRTILDAAATAVKAGGRLLYSTCTFAPEENECQVAWFLQTHPDFTLVKLDLPFGTPAFAWERVASFAPDLSAPQADLTYARRILPPEGEGHFLALFVRTYGEDDTPSSRRPTTFPCDKTTDRQARELYEDCFLTPPRGTFACFGDTVRLLPADLPPTKGLHILAAGVTVAVRRGNRLEPSHGLFAATRAEDCRRRVDLSADDPRLTAFLRGEEIAVPDTLRGYTAVTVCDTVLGFGKAVGGRLKNRYPKGLRQITG